jgi:DNA-binding XRE family transcriptional regulator
LSRKAIHGYSKDTVNRFTRKLVCDIMQQNSKKESPLEVLRKRADVTQEAVATAIGVTDHTYRNWIKGRAEAKLTIRQIKSLCEVLGCELKDLPNDFFEV